MKRECQGVVRWERSAGSLDNRGGHWGPRNADSIMPEMDVSQ